MTLGLAIALSVMGHLESEEMEEENEWKPATQECECGDGESLEYRVVTSSDGAYDDYQYRCKACGKTFWVDGPDA